MTARPLGVDQTEVYMDTSGMIAGGGVVDSGLPMPAHAGVGRCAGCGYDLTGLRDDGVCPECATSVAFSRAGFTLRFSAPEYLKKVHVGVVLVLAAIAGAFVLSIGSMGLGMTVGVIGVPGGSVALLAGLMLACFLALMVGFWLFSAPDPRFAAIRGGSASRAVLRIAVAVGAASMLANWVIEIVASSGPDPLAVGLGIVISLISFAAWGTGYFASLVYVRWFARRLPNDRIVRRAATMMWFGPVIVIGSYAAVFVLFFLLPGPAMIIGMLGLFLGVIIVLVMYWNMLDWVRKDLKRIRREQRQDPALRAAQPA